jgi:cell division septation protein DedD
MNRQTAWQTVKQIGTVSAKVWGVLFCVMAFAALAYFYGGEVAAAPANQTIPPRTPQATATGVPTVTPTSQQPATNTPQPATATPTVSGPARRADGHKHTHSPAPTDRHADCADDADRSACLLVAGADVRRLWDGPAGE